MMKRFLVIVLLMSSAAQANGLKKAWNNFGKGNKAIYGGKALFAGWLAYVTLRCGCYEEYKENEWLFVDVGHKPEGWFEESDYVWLGSRKAEIVPRKIAMMGLSGYGAFLLLKQAWHDAKHAVGKE